MSIARLLVVGLAVISPAVPASADEGVTASHVAVYRPDGDTAILGVVCTGQAVRATAKVVVTCEIADATGPRSSETCASPVSTGACATSVVDAVQPVVACATAVATLSDGSTVSDRRCITYV